MRLANDNYLYKSKQKQYKGLDLSKDSKRWLKGGQIKKIDTSIFMSLYQQYKSRQINKVQFAKALNISRPTLDKRLKEIR